MSIITAIVPAKVRSGFETHRFLALDILERVIVACMFSQFAYAMLNDYGARPQIGTLLILVSEVATITMILMRRFSTSISQQPLDWLLAIAGCCTPLLAVPADHGSQAVTQIGVGLMILGLCVQISAKAILFRSFGIIAANRGLKDKGPYRFVRHPMYAGYVISHFGYIFGWPSMHNLSLYTLALIIQMARLLREEELLSQDPKYRAYKKRVRYRLLPGVF
jgi:protein-S-isoprenylcysteine O-methyltransferase Ste14